MALDLTIRRLTGHTDRIQILRNETVLKLKQLISSRLPDIPVHRVKLIANYSGPGTGTVLEDDTRTLSSYSSVTSGTTLFLVVLSPFKIYVQEPSSKMFEVEIPDKNPEAYPIGDLRVLVEKISGLSLDDYQFQFKGKPLEESNHGKKFTLQDHKIDKEDTLFLMKLGFVLNITQPMVDLCFMVDCTGSMGSWIESVKNNVKELRDRLETQYKGCDLKFAFVRYTDYDQPESTRTTWLNFTKSLQDFHSFVNPIVANGGGDGPEDIMGALKVTLSKLSWRSSAAKILIHIADAPCHGSQYHDGGDTYPNGDPAGITHEQMMREVAQKEIQYWFGYINKASTDKMISIFNDSLKEHSKQTLLLRQFEAVQPEQIRDAVHKSVTASVTATEAKKASARSLDSSAVNWSSISEKQATKTPVVGTKTVQDLQGGLKLSPPSVRCTLKMAPNPFTDGEESVVFKGLDTGRNSQTTLKQLKAAGNSYEKYEKMQEIQVIASAYAHEFNTDARKPSHLQAIEFIKVDVVNVGGTYYILQEFIDGKFEKYNTNNGIICPNPPQSDMMQAFSHFTYVQSSGSLLICDLEGIQKGGRVLLTDPAIHNRMCPKKYGPTDSGFLGIKRFFNSHECKSICQSMELQNVKA